MSVTYVPSTATLVNIITTTPRTLLLPLANERQGRVITVKDVTGLANTNPITISTQGTNTFDGSSNIYTLSNAYTAATFVSRNNNWLLTSATPINAVTFSTLTGLGTAGYVSTSQLTSTIDGLGSSDYVSSSQLISTVTGIANNVSGVTGSQINSTIDGLATTGYVSSSQLFSTIAALGTAGGDVTRWNLFSTTNGLGQIYLSSFLYPYALSTQLLSTTRGLGILYLSTPSLASTVRNLGTAGYLSTQHLFSSIAGLGQIFISAPNTVLASQISTGVSTNYLNALNSFVLTETANNIFTGELTVSTNLFVNDAPLSLAYATTTPAFPLSITSPAGQPQTFRMTAGTGALTMSLDGNSNATIASDIPNVSRNPLNFQAYTITAATSSFIFAPNLTLNPTNNTQIIGSTISTSITLGNQLIFSSLMGDGSQIYNLTAVSTPTVYSTVTGYAASMNVVSTATLQSTVSGLPLYLGYLSTATIGPVISTALLTASSAQITTGINAGFIQLSNTITSNIWVAVGVGASAAATIQTSPDGLTWTNSLSGGFSANGNGVAWNGKYWVAVGNDTTNKIQYSSNATDWLATSGATFSGQGNDVAWNGSMWVAVGTDATNTIKYSFDSVNWINSSGFTTSGLGVAWNGFIWVAVGSDTTAANAIRYSYDGITWFASAATENSTYQSAVAWNGYMWLVGGTTSVSGNSISYSKDGINWILSAAPFQSAATHIAWNGTIWLATGTDTGATYPIYSYDGLKWTYGTGVQFSVNALSAQWNGTYWVAVGQDATNSVKYSSDGINWINSTANNFTTSANAVGFSSNLTPSYQQANFRAHAQPIPLFFDSTNQFLFTPTSLVINNTLNINNRLDRVGINCNAPSYDLDIYGSANVSSVLYASSFVGDGSRLLNITTQSLLTSSIDGLGNLGYVSSLDFSTLTDLAISSIGLTNYISTEGLNTALGSTTTSLISRFTAPVYISASFSTVTAFTLLVCTIQTSSIRTSTLVSADSAFQRIITSSLRFFEGDGFLTGLDIQASNISTIAFYTSSIRTNAIATSNLRIGSNVNQNILQFYGLTGNFNNTVITEQSTGSLTHELLLFNGSNSSNQIRVQTTGAFRIETGVSANLYPNMPQQTNARLLIDSNGSMNIDNWVFFVDALTNRIGLNLGVGNRPQVDFDMLGTFRTPNMVVNTANISTLISINAGFSTILISSTTLLPASTVISQLINTNTLNASTINATSSVFSTLIVSSVLTTSSFFTTIGNAFNFTISSLSANTISTNLLFANNVFFSTLKISTFNTNFLATQSLLTSSLGFFQGDGFLTGMDIQNSNISTIALYTSSIKTNAIATSNLRIGSNVNQNILQFYGLTGNFNNNVITEQSTGSLTHELLLFNGSNSSNQIRIQTTGAFRIETGVSANLYPNMPQQTNARLLIDSNGSMNIDNWVFFVDALTNRIGLNLGVNNRPQVDFDMLGTFRAPNIVINTANISTLISINAGFSTILISSTTLLPASTVISQLINTNTLNASTINATSSVFSTLIISSVLTTSSFFTTIGNAFNFTISSLSANTISTNLLFANATFVSSTLVSTLSAYNTTTQRLLVSSLRFYDGDGFISLPDLQTSNVSTIAFYASSIATNGIIASNIGVNTKIPQFMLDVNGNARVSTLFIDTGAMRSTTTTFSLSVWGAGGPARVGGTTWTQISDRRMKESIVEADYTMCYEDIKAIPLRRFTYTSTFFETVPLRDRNVLGFIAQEVKELQPKSIVVSEAFGVSDLNWLNIDQLNMSLYGAVKKLINDKEELTSSVIGLQTLLGFCMSTVATLGGNI